MAVNANRTTNRLDVSSFDGTNVIPGGEIAYLSDIPPAPSNNLDLAVAVLSSSTGQTGAPSSFSSATAFSGITINPLTTAASQAKINSSNASFTPTRTGFYRCVVAASFVGTGGVAKLEVGVASGSASGAKLIPADVVGCTVLAGSDSYGVIRSDTILYLTSGTAYFPFFQADSANSTATNITMQQAGTQITWQQMPTDQNQ